MGSEIGSEHVQCMFCVMAAPTAFLPIDNMCALAGLLLSCLLVTQEYTSPGFFHKRNSFKLNCSLSVGTMMLE